MSRSSPWSRVDLERVLLARQLEAEQFEGDRVQALASPVAATPSEAVTGRASVLQWLQTEEEAQRAEETHEDVAKAAARVSLGQLGQGVTLRARPRDGGRIAKQEAAEAAEADVVTDGESDTSSFAHHPSDSARAVSTRRDSGEKGAGAVPAVAAAAKVTLITNGEDHSHSSFAKPLPTPERSFSIRKGGAGDRGHGRTDAGSAELSEAPDRMPRFLLDPDSRWMGFWDLFTGITLLVVALFTPYEIAFLPSPTSFGDTLFVFGRAIDAIFIADMLLCFNTSIPSERDPSKLETRRSVVISSYLRGWFLLDSFSLSSSAFDVVPVVMGSASGAKSPLTSFRVIRILRLVKLIRLLRASDKLRDWSVQFAMPRAVLTIVTALSQVTYLIHLVACMFKLLTVIPDSPLDTWLATHGYCMPVEDAFEEDAGVGFECSSAGYIYLQTVWWSAGMILGAPIGHAPSQGPFESYYSRPEEPVKLTVMEQVFVIVFKTVSAFFFLTVTARFVTVYNNLNPDAKAFNQGMDALNSFVNYFNLAKADGRELRRYYVERMEEASAFSPRRPPHAVH